MPYLLQLKKDKLDTVDTGDPCIVFPEPFPLHPSLEAEFSVYYSHAYFYTFTAHLCNHKQYCFTAVKT